jgi:tRNA-guanine family transglycosylase
MANEMLAGTLVTSHNLTFLQSLLARARAAIEARAFTQFADAFLAAYPKP